jgi:hypothetical protein
MVSTVCCDSEFCVNLLVDYFILISNLVHSLGLRCSVLLCRGVILTLQDRNEMVGSQSIRKWLAGNDSSNSVEEVNSESIRF